ncbi:MAG: hypothetical protein EOP38_15450 [Rubrivivax sp.]|nr:MAG: hypothetical protein EOP38_15450 [Rubrivivax sp.]
MPKSVPRTGLTANDDGDAPGAIAIPHLQDVDDAAYRIAHEFPGRVPALAQRMGVPPSTLNKKVSPNCESHRLSVADAVHLQLVAGRFDILYAMASQLDHVCLHMPDETASEVGMRLARVGAEVGDVFRVAQKAMEDGSITPNERRELSGQIAEAISALASVLKAL